MPEARLWLQRCNLLAPLVRSFEIGESKNENRESNHGDPSMPNGYACDGYATTGTFACTSATTDCDGADGGAGKLSPV